MLAGLRTRLLPIMLIGIAVLAFACCLVLWEPAYASYDGKPVVVSMGDSYSSGEGVEDFYDQELSDKNKKPNWLAHRSKEAWPGLLKVSGQKLRGIKDKGWYFVASSGAKTNNILGTTDPDEPADTLGKQTQKWKDWKSLEPSTGSKQLDCQMDVFDKLPEGSTVDYVTMTIGGNDVGFAHVLKVAALEGVPFVNQGSLDTVLKDGLVKFNEMRDSGTFLDVYNKVLEKAGPDAYLIVAGYPHLFSPGDHEVYFNEDFHTGVLGIGVKADQVTKINRVIDTFISGMKGIVKQSGNPHLVFADVVPEFNGHEDSYINPMWKFPKKEDLNQSSDITNVSAYSCHPSKDGQAAYARVVQRIIDELEKQKSAGGTQPAQSAQPDQKPVENVDIASDANMSLVFDVSGSMEEYSGMNGVTKLESAKRQSTDFVSAIRSSGGADGMSVKVGVVSFSDDVSVECGLSNNPDDINGAINGLTAYGRTNIYAGLKAGMEQLQSDGGGGLIVFLSDGLSNEGPDSSAILALAQDAADAGIRVYTIGFGPSSEIDEELLRQIASITGGAYSHEDSSDIMSAAVGLFATMMDAHLSSTSQVLTSGTGTVQQGGTASMGSFDVSGNGTLKTYLYWPGSVLDMQLTDPDGVLVDSGYAGCVFDDSTIPTTITVSNAKQGTWQMAVYGAEVSMENEPFYAAASLDAAQQAAPTGGGGGAANGGEGLLFLFIVLAVACIVGVFAFSRRRGSRG